MSDPELSEPSAAFGLSDRLGPCRLIARLGSGAFGTVYLARLEEERSFGRVGDKVAVKILRRTSKASDLARFLREAELGSAVKHPAVVRTFYSGREDLADHSLHYLVMEYVEGRTLRQVMDQFGAVPENLLQALAIQITAALDAVHRAGAIHRDLKPTNILITEDYQVKLSDMGLARVTDDGRSLTSSGMFLGTFKYSAPEQLQGQKLSAATDLYALGVVLYEAATGNQPFAASSLEAAFLRHLHEVPPRVGKLRPEISSFFEEVIAQLLEKSPERRFSSAHELLATLRDGDASLWWLARQKVLRATGPRKRPKCFSAVDQELPFVGREEHLERLLAAWRSCLEGRGKLVLVVGEAGIGKSRLLEAFHHRLADTGGEFHLLYGSDSPGSRFGPGAFARALADYLGEIDFETRLAELLPHGRRLLPGFAAYLRGMPIPPEAGPLSQETVHSLFRQVIKSLAEEQPVVWMIEDLHFAPAETGALLASMVQVARGLPCLIVATCRPEATVKIGKALQNRGAPERLLVERFATAEIERLLERALPMEEWLRFGRKIARRSDGNPLFLAEMIREAKNATVAGDADPRTTWIREVPASLKDLLEARFGDLEEADRALLQCGAVEGFEFAPELLARVRGANLLEILERLTEIERRQGLIKSTERGFRFVHHLLQEVIYACLPASLRRHYHHSLAAALAESSAGSEVKGELAVSLCEHFLKGAGADRGLPFALEALDHLAHCHNYEKLLELGDLVLSAAPVDDAILHIEVLLHQTECFYLLGRRDEEARAAEKAFDLATAHGDSSRAMRARLLQGRLLVDAGPHALGMLEKTLDEVRAMGDSLTEARVLGQLGQAHLRSGRFERSLEFYRRQLELSRSLGESAGIADAQCSMGEAFLGLHRAEDAREPLRECIVLCEDLGLSSLKARSYHAFALTLNFMADYLEAREYYEKCLELCRELGYLEMEIGALSNYSNLCLIEGNVKRAGTLHARRKILSQARSTPFLDAYLHLESGNLHRVRREFERSCRAFDAALDLFTEIGASYGMVQVWMGLGRVAFETRDHQRAVDCFQRAAELCDNQDIEVFTSLIKAYQAALGSLDPDEVTTMESLRLPERVEGHWLLSLALGSREHRDHSLRLLHRMSAHLEGQAERDFWRYHPVARAVQAAQEANSGLEA